MKRQHHPDTLYLSVSGRAISPVMSGRAAEAKWSGAGEVEAPMNNLKWIQCWMKEFSPSVLQSPSACGAVWRGDTRREASTGLLTSRFQLKLRGTTGNPRMIPYFCLLLCWLAHPLQGKKIIVLQLPWTTKTLSWRWVEASSSSSQTAASIMSNC